MLLTICPRSLIDDASSRPPALVYPDSHLSVTVLVDRYNNVAGDIMDADHDRLRRRHIYSQLMNRACSCCNERQR